mgnify:CR=1 FL=1
MSVSNRFFEREVKNYLFTVSIDASYLSDGDEETSDSKFDV